MVVHPHNYQPLSSDHYIISFQLTIPAKATLNHSPSFIFDFNKADYNSLNNFLSTIDYFVCERLPDVNSIWSFIRNNILDGMNTYIPKITIQPANQLPKWFTPDIRHQIKCLQTLRRKHKHHPTEHTTARLNSAEVNLKNSIKQAKTNFEANLINNFAFNNESKIYKYIKRLIPFPLPSFQENVATRDIDKANLFNQFFFSIFTPNLGSLPSYDELPTINSSLSAIQIFPDEVYNALSSLDPTKATGIDGIGSDPRY